MINNNTLPKTGQTAVIALRNHEEAQQFAKAWTRETLTGCDITGPSVTVYDITDERKEFIEAYAAALNA